MTAYHIVRSFDDDLQFLRDKITEMGKISERLMDQAVTAIIQNDQELALRVIAEDSILDQAERFIGERAVAIIAKRQPMAIDLRELIGAIRISSDFERIGDLAKSVAKRSRMMGDAPRSVSFYRGLEIFCDLALKQLRSVVETYTNRSLAGIKGLHSREGEIDSMYNSLFREILTYMMEDARNITPCTHLLFCAKNIERIGDHAANIAETLYYVITGDYMVIEGSSKENKVL